MNAGGSHAALHTYATAGGGEYKAEATHTSNSTSTALQLGFTDGGNEKGHRLLSLISDQNSVALSEKLVSGFSINARCSSVMQIAQFRGVTPPLAPNNLRLVARLVARSQRSFKWSGR